MRLASSFLIPAIFVSFLFLAQVEPAFGKKDLITLFICSCLSELKYIGKPVK
jgi:hypothetical protein